MRLWPDTLAGRTLALLIGMTLLLIIGSAWLLQDERRERFDERNRFRLVDRIHTLVRLLDDADDTERRRIIDRVAKRGDTIELTPQPRVTTDHRRPLERMIARRLGRSLHLGDRSAVRVHVALKRGEHDDDDDDEHEPRNRRERHARVHDLDSVTVSVRLRDGSWLNIQTENFEGPPPWAGKTLQLLALLLIVLVVSGLLLARRMARPMARLAEAAERFGLGQSQAPLAEKGPREVRHTIRAFNEMQERLHRHITERSQMLAAVSHDLRTPITTLRLRAEYIEDAEMRDKTLATLAEMEAILSATLSFARDEAADEASRSTDLAAMLQSLVDDHVDLGGEAHYDGPDRLVVTCRPIALKRAINNLIENALKYGDCAAVGLSHNKDSVEIRIDDQGPGIPAEQIEQVFAPFFRVESSRSRDTGGSGLGLAVARTIVLAHGGRIELVNRPEGGLRATVLLPQ